MSRGQLGHGPQRYGADVMNVQLNFGKTGDKALRDSHAGQSPRLWPLQVEPYSACSRRDQKEHTYPALATHHAQRCRIAATPGKLRPNVR